MAKHNKIPKLDVKGLKQRNPEKKGEVSVE